MGTGESAQGESRRRVPIAGDIYHQTNAGRPRIESLTGLRWFAALAVFLSHNVPEGRTPVSISTFFSSGYMGVTLFFVLSGFVLTITYGGVMARPCFADVWNYGVARIARVMPLYWLVLALLVLAVNGFGSPQTYEGLWCHVLAIQAWFGDLKIAYGWNAPGWSVGVELFLYAVFPILILITWVLTSTRRALIVAALVVLGMVALVVLFHVTGGDVLPREDPASVHRWIYRCPLTRVGDFTLGICAAIIYTRERNRARLVAAAPLIAAAMVVLIFALMTLPSLLDSSPSYDLAYALPAAILIFSLALAPDQGISRLLGSVSLVALGEFSYAFYLIHIPVGSLLQGAGVSANGFTPLSVANTTFVLLLLITISWALHVSFERPARVFLRKKFSLPVT